MKRLIKNNLSNKVYFEVLEKPSQEKIKIVHDLINKIVTNLTKNRFTIFLLDDAHNVDNESWEYLPTLCKNSKSLMVLAMRPFTIDKAPPDAAKEVSEVCTIKSRKTQLPCSHVQF